MYHLRKILYALFFAIQKSIFFKYTFLLLYLFFCFIYFDHLYRSFMNCKQINRSRKFEHIRYYFLLSNYTKYLFLKKSFIISYSKEYKKQTNKRYLKGFTFAKTELRIRRNAQTEAHLFLSHQRGRKVTGFFTLEPPKSLEKTSRKSFPASLLVTITHNIFTVSSY